jgi:hypothetical protein
MMGFKKLLLPLVAGVMAMALVIPAVAQDATATVDPNTTGTTGTTDTTTQGTGMLNCDSSTILLAGLAERYFGYAPTDVTLSNYSYGQYSPLFDMSSMSTSGAGTTGEATMEATMDTSGAAGSATLVPSTGGVLSPAVISGEDPSCTQLRTSLETFFSAQMAMGTSAWDSKMNGTGASG